MLQIKGAQSFRREQPVNTVHALQDDPTSLPMLSVPHDVFRQGLGTLKDDIGHQHVVEAIQKNVRPKAHQLEHCLLALKQDVLVVHQ